MTFENQVKEEVDCVDVIIELSKLLKKHKDCGNVLAITTAKVPIVKFYLRSCKREADISLYNTLALENTKMLATYAKLDDRVATLGYAVKVFAKVSLNEGRYNLSARVKTVKSFDECASFGIFCDCKAIAMAAGRYAKHKG